MSNYIITAEPIEQFNCKGESIGMSEKLAVFYSPTIGRKRFYRNSFNNPNIIGLKLLDFKTEKAAQEVCDATNLISQHIYKVEAISNDNEFIQQGGRKIDYSKDSPLLSERSILVNKLFLKQTFTGKKKQIAFLQKVKTMSIEQIKEALSIHEPKESIRTIAEILKEADCTPGLQGLINLWNEIAINNKKYTLVDLRFAHMHIRKLILMSTACGLVKWKVFETLKRQCDDVENYDCYHSQYCDKQTPDMKCLYGLGCSFKVESDV